MGHQNVRSEFCCIQVPVACWYAFCLWSHTVETFEGGRLATLAWPFTWEIHVLWLQNLRK